MNVVRFSRKFSFEMKQPISFFPLSRDATTNAEVIQGMRFSSAVTSSSLIKSMDELSVTAGKDRVGERGEETEAEREDERDDGREEKREEERGEEGEVER